MLLKRKDKRGVMGILLFFAFLFLILVLGFIATIVVAVLDFGGDTITPIMQDIGMAGTSNISEYVEYSVVPLNNLVQALPWLIGFGFICAIIFSVIFAVSYRYNPNPVYIGLYLMLILLLIFGSIIMSNMYEDIYTGTDEIATRLQSQTISTYLILYSPVIFTIIAFLTGIYLFVGRREEGVYGI